MEGSKLSDKQRNFCLEYLKDFNATQAAIRAGYSKNSANEQAARMLAKASIQEYIKEISQKVERKKIMDIQEIQERLSAIARGETFEDVVVTENVGDFMSEARVMEKKVSAREQVKALELLGKANAMFVEKVDASVGTDNKKILVEYLNGAKDGKFNR